MKLRQIIQSRIVQLREDLRDYDMSMMSCINEGLDKDAARNRRWMKETRSAIEELENVLDLYDNWYQKKKERCYKCGGDGEILDMFGYETCPVCSGNGQIVIE